MIYCVLKSLVIKADDMNDALEIKEMLEAGGKSVLIVKEVSDCECE